MDRRGFEGGFEGGPMDRSMGQRGRMGMRGWGMGRQGFGRAGFLNNEAIRQRLGITSAQSAKIRQQDSDFQKSQIRDRADLQVKRIELDELLAADNPNRAAINVKLQEVSASQMALEKSAIDNRLALRDILTPAQRQQLQQLRTNGFQPGGPAQTPPGAARGGRGPGQRGNPPPPNQQDQAPAK
jgi:Spy/CpxP family protein refolding chaperone